MPVMIKMTEAQREKLRQLGGAAWVRGRIDEGAKKVGSGQVLIHGRHKHDAVLFDLAANAFADAAIDAVVVLADSAATAANATARRS